MQAGRCGRALPVPVPCYWAAWVLVLSLPWPTILVTPLTVLSPHVCTLQCNGDPLFSSPIWHMCPLTAHNSVVKGLVWQIFLNITSFSFQATGRNTHDVQYKGCFLHSLNTYFHFLKHVHLICTKCVCVRHAPAHVPYSAIPSLVHTMLLTLQLSWPLVTSAGMTRGHHHTTQHHAHLNRPTLITTLATSTSNGLYAILKTFFKHSM